MTKEERLQKQLARLAEMKRMEQVLHTQGYQFVAGVDAAQAGEYLIGFFPKADERSSEALSSAEAASSSSAADGYVEMKLDSLYEEVVLTESDTVWFKLATTASKKYTVTCLDNYSAKVVGLYGSDVVLDVFGADRKTPVAQNLDFAGVSTEKFSATGATTWIAVRMNLLPGFFGLMVTKD